MGLAAATPTLVCFPVQLLLTVFIDITNAITALKHILAVSILHAAHLILIAAHSTTVTAPLIPARLTCPTPIIPAALTMNAAHRSASATTAPLATVQEIPPAVSII